MKFIKIANNYIKKKKIIVITEINETEYSDYTKIYFYVNYIVHSRRATSIKCNFDTRHQAVKERERIMNILNGREDTPTDEEIRDEAYQRYPIKQPLTHDYDVNLEKRLAFMQGVEFTRD